MIAAYGQDDRVCAHPSLTASLSKRKTPARTCVVALVDKEEIGSEGDDGLAQCCVEAFSYIAV